MNSNIKTGISTASFYPSYTDEAFTYLCENGIKNIEVFINTYCEMKPPIINNIKRLADEYGINVTSLHPFTGAIEPFMMFTKYERRFDDMLDFFKNFFEAAANLGAPYFVFHGDKRQGTFTNEEYFERIDRLFDTAKSFGVTFLQENVERCKSGTIEFVEDMKKQLGDKAQFTLDIKQAVRRDVDPIEMLKAMGTSLKHIHISDNTKDNSCMLVGEGTFDFYKMKELLLEFDFKGALILEYYDFCYKQRQEVLDSLERLNKIIYG